MYVSAVMKKHGELTMATEQSQTLTTACETPVSRAVQGCPACGAALVPLRGQWRCSRCYFTWCVGCEVLTGQEQPREDD
jgi:hypothetical protein